MKTLKSINCYLDKITSNKPFSKRIPLVIIGNKSDLVVQKHQLKSASRKLSKVIKGVGPEYKLRHIFASAKQDTNVSEAFKMVTNLFVENMKDDNLESMMKIHKTFKKKNPDLEVQGLDLFDCCCSKSNCQIF